MAPRGRAGDPGPSPLTWAFAPKPGPAWDARLHQTDVSQPPGPRTTTLPAEQHAIFSQSFDLALMAVSYFCRRCFSSKVLTLAICSSQLQTPRQYHRVCSCLSLHRQTINGRLDLAMRHAPKTGTGHDIPRRPNSPALNPLPVEKLQPLVRTTLSRLQLPSSCFHL